MDNAQFSKFARECKVDNKQQKYVAREYRQTSLPQPNYQQLLSKRCTRQGVDLIFASIKPKGKRKINFPAFMQVRVVKCFCGTVIKICLLYTSDAADE